VGDTSGRDSKKDGEVALLWLGGSGIYMGSGIYGIHWEVGDGMCDDAMYNPLIEYKTYTSE